MAPIIPNDILDAFSPLLTTGGGIKQVDKSQYLHLFSIMKNCSTKLVSRCIYCEILMATSSDVLEQFLKIGVWNLIGVWIKTSKDNGSVAYLLSLLKLLQTLPMNIERLRENDCPKIVKKLCKHENEEVALKADLIIKKWTSIIQNSVGKPPNDSDGSGSSAISEKKEKKRKPENESSASSKKIKSSISNSTNSNSSSSSSSGSNSISAATKSGVAVDSATEQSNDSDLYESFSRDEMNKFMINSKEPPAQRSRPVTVKVKPGKFRLDLSAASSTKTSAPNVKKKSNDLKDSTKAGTDGKKLTALSSSKSVKGKILSPSAPSSKAPPSSNTSHILKDSMSFMDALTVMPVVNRKVRRKLNKECEQSTTSNNKITNSHQEERAKAELSASEQNSSAHNISGASTTTSSSSALSCGDTANLLDADSASSSVGTAATSSDKNELELRLQESNDSSGNSISTTPTESHKSPPRFSFYKDILEDVKSEGEDSGRGVGGVAGDGERISSDVAANDTLAGNQISSPDEISNTEIEHLSTSDSSENLSTIRSQEDADERFSPPSVSVADGEISSKIPKPILNYIKKGSKKSVRWPDDDTDLVQIEYFEIEENERINVTRQQQNDIKRFDMKHEGQLLLEAKKRCITYIAWKLIPIYVHPSNSPVEIGCNSKERHTQAERTKATLECFYMQNQIPDSPREPDSVFFSAPEKDKEKEAGDGDDERPLLSEPKIIPLEDENMTDKVNDYSNINISQPIVPEPMVQQSSYDDYSGGIPQPPPFNAATTDYSMANNYMPPPAAGQQYPLPPNVPGGVANQWPPVNYDVPNANNMNSNYGYNNNNSFPNQLNAGPPNQIPPPSFSNAPPFQNDYQSNYGPGPMPNPNANPNTMFNTNQPPPNYFNPGPPPPQPPPSELGPYNSYWPENKNGPTPGPPPPNNYPPPGPGGQFHPQHAGPRFPGPRPGKRGGGGRRQNDGLCRFFVKFGKCKFEQRCNFSHALDKPRF